MSWPIGQDAGAGDGQDLPVVAGRGVPGQAGRAGAVGEVGLDDDPLADLPTGDTGPGGDDVAAALEAEHPRHARHLAGAVVDRQVRAAEPDPTDLDDHVVRTGLGLGPVVDNLHLSRRHQRDRSHSPSVRVGHNYYDDLDARWELDPAMRTSGILYDRDEAGGYDGYGESNAPVRAAAQLAAENLPT